VAGPPTAAIQGLGQVGSSAARLLDKAGLRLVAVSDSKGGAYNAKGLDLPALDEHRKFHGGVAGLKDAEDISIAELLELPVTVLVLAAVENHITETNADRVHASLITEAANAALTPEADAVQQGRGVFVV